jgi:hypothetical protein
MPLVRQELGQATAIGAEKGHGHAFRMDRVAHAKTRGGLCELVIPEDDHSLAVVTVARKGHPAETRAGADAVVPFHHCRGARALRNDEDHVSHRRPLFLGHDDDVLHFSGSCCYCVEDPSWEMTAVVLLRQPLRTASVRTSDAIEYRVSRERNFSFWSLFSKSRNQTRSSRSRISHPNMTIYPCL